MKLSFAVKMAAPFVGLGLFLATSSIATSQQSEPRGNDEHRQSAKAECDKVPDGGFCRYLTGVLFYAMQRYSAAAKEFEIAANLGWVPAQAELGGLHELGLGVIQDYVQAYKWYNLAATAPQRWMRLMMRSSRDSVAARMTSSQIAEAQRQSREWLTKHQICWPCP